MGGGSGFGRSSLGNIEKLEKKAREELEKGARRNTFLSFDYDDSNEVELLRGQAKNDKSKIEFIDYSVKVAINSEKAETIKKEISDRIRQCSQTVVYITDATSSSSWVKWEVEKSLQLGKDVIAVHKGDSPPSKIPSCIKDNNIKIVSWSNLSDSL